MKYYPVTFILFITLAILCTPVSAGQAPIMLTEPFFDVAGAVSTDVSAVAGSSGGSWVVLRIFPAPNSGIPHFDNKTSGTLLSANDLVSGTFAVVSSIEDRSVAQNGTYSWQAALLPYLDMSSPYVCQPNPVYIICDLATEAPGIAEFGSGERVPPPWINTLKPAVAKLRQLLAAGNPVPYEHFLTNKDPYLVLAACRTLMSANQMSTSDMALALSSHDVYLRAAVIGLSRSLHWVDSPTNGQWLLDYVNGIRTTEGLLSVGYGITTELILMRSADVDSAYEDKVMHEVRQKLNQIDPQGGPSDPVWNDIDNACRARFQ